jgi:hypothetical protein
MTLKEAMGYLPGGHELMNPATNINVQVVQPRTRQAEVPQQSGKGYEKAKRLYNRELKKHDIDDYNDRDRDELNTYYEYEPETDDEVSRRIKRLKRPKKKEKKNGSE